MTTTTRRGTPRHAVPPRRFAPGMYGGQRSGGSSWWWQISPVATHRCVRGRREAAMGRGVRYGAVGAAIRFHVGFGPRPVGVGPRCTLGPLREILPHVIQVVASQCGDASPARVFFPYILAVRSSRTPANQRTRLTRDAARILAHPDAEMGSSFCLSTSGSCCRTPPKKTARR